MKTTADDVVAIVKYLKTKPAGASVADGKAVSAKMVDSRKLAAYGTWGVIEREDGRLKLTERGRRLARKPDESAPVFAEIIGSVKPYRSAVEWAYHGSHTSMDTNDVAGHWYEHHVDSVGADASEHTLRDNAVAFFHVVAAAKLGTLMLGRGGKPTRIDLDASALAKFIENEGAVPDEDPTEPATPTDDPELPAFARPPADPAIEKPEEPGKPEAAIEVNRRVFITHGKDKKIVGQLKELLTYGKFEPVVSVERESVSQPVPNKVLDDMRSCAAAVIHVGAEQVLKDADDKDVTVLNPNVLIEIGAAMMKYGRNFILLVEEGTDLPSNLQGLYEVRYSGDGLDHTSTMKLLKAFNDFD
ncbi:hypothetical protein PAI11_11700 [Patulibacter medicamentivorans]|uniref:CD-NTase-associated protein 12/Pycsar effector protein TIR domain-containing protein n=1 Tax=Patulibacter medicamentivorans TaxID=1097667 RepID=H0E305_9ACTN|nr:hypothetical protein PAI11_11700 [Patulibacter medicamentivorans]